MCNTHALHGKLGSSQIRREATEQQLMSLAHTIQEIARKARRSSGLREILSLAMESGSAGGGSAVPITWDGAHDSRRASRACVLSPPAAAKPPLPAPAGRGAKAQKGSAPQQPADKGTPGEALGSGKAGVKGAAKAEPRGGKAATAKEGPKSATEAKPAKGAAVSKAAQQKGCAPAAKGKEAPSKAAGKNGCASAVDAKAKPAASRVSPMLYPLHTSMAQ